MKKPNLIYVFADQLRYSSLGYNGDEKAFTPNIDAFSKESVIMDNAVSGHPVCAPYRASLFTGKYTTSTGMVINEIRINQNHRTFANVLSENGYETCYIGKWHMWANKLGDHFNPDNSYVPKGERLGFNNFFAGYNFHHEYYSPKAYYHLDSKEKIYYDGYEPDCQTDMAIERLKAMASSDKPFALFLSIGTPHDPWLKENVPEKYYEMFRNVDFPNPDNYLPFNDPYADDWARLSDEERSCLEEWRRVYYAMTANLDYNFGRIVSAVKELGLDENSILVFTSDHGELFGAHGRRAKNIFYDEAVRVPFLIRGKEFTPGICSADFNTVDIMPTLLSYMGLPVPEGVQGTDKRDEIDGTAERDDGSLMMCTGPTAVFGDGNEWRALRTKRYTYAVYKKDGKELLFDNENDRLQKNDLSDNPGYAEIKSVLRDKMFRKMEKINDKFRHNSYYRDNWVTDRCIKDSLIP